MLFRTQQEKSPSNILLGIAQLQSSYLVGQEPWQLVVTMYNITALK